MESVRPCGRERFGRNFPSQFCVLCVKSGHVILCTSLYGMVVNSLYGMVVNQKKTGYSNVKIKTMRNENGRGYL